MLGSATTASLTILRRGSSDSRKASCQRPSGLEGTLPEAMTLRSARKARSQRLPRRSTSWRCSPDARPCAEPPSTSPTAEAPSMACSGRIRARHRAPGRRRPSRVECHPQAPCRTRKDGSSAPCRSSCRHSPTASHARPPPSIGRIPHASVSLSYDETGARDRRECRGLGMEERRGVEVNMAKSLS